MSASDPKPANGLPEGVSFWHPATLIATWFGVGLLPKMPGTFGSLAALPIAWFLGERFGPYAVAGAGLALFVLGLWASHVYLRRARAKDPGEIVVDEVSAQLIACAPAGLDPLGFALAFILFRIFDIMKPWPISALERGLPGALGVMADDAAAALFTAALVIIFYIILERPSVFF
ncbi:MAG: phosphatidylglycerophosphatase A [Alphaproteobacteria bacterium]|jgi:phosphatidylglycerophosphatase A